MNRSQKALLKLKAFSEINLNDPFFDSLKADYHGFSGWFEGKAAKGSKAYVAAGDDGGLTAFLHLKPEDKTVNDVSPPLDSDRLLKIATMKVDSHGTRLGERLIKTTLDIAIEKGFNKIYVTIFPKHTWLAGLLGRFGFSRHGTKTTADGQEDVLLKDLKAPCSDPLTCYPFVNLNNSNIFLLAVLPKWHTRLFPDSILKTESADVVRDLSFTNSIFKVYLSAMAGTADLKRGDILLIYRTADEGKRAEYSSVVTSVCVVDEYKHIDSFTSPDEFMKYCGPYSVFDDSELTGFWQKRKYPHLIRFTYNFALPKRVIRKVLMEECGFDRSERFSFVPVSREQFRLICEKGNANESLVVDQA